MGALLCLNREANTLSRYELGGTGPRLSHRYHANTPHAEYEQPVLDCMFNKPPEHLKVATESVEVTEAPTA